jgi:hypothetical protein
MSLYPKSIWERFFIASEEVLGRPYIVGHATGISFFAASVRGSLAVRDSGTSIGAAIGAQIVVGAISASGEPMWLLRDSILSTGTSTEPVLAIGPSGSLFIAFTTTGSTPGNRNMQYVFSPCGGCQKAPEDIVLARIDDVFGAAPVLAWVQQDAKLSSCASESSPCLHYDRYLGRLLVAYQTNGATLCQVRVGTTNIVVASMSTDGALGWAEQSAIINCTGENVSPKLAVDTSGGIYVAYSVTTAVPGGQIVGNRDIEIVRLHVTQGGCNTVVKRDWIRSATDAHALNTTEIDSEPDILYNAFDDSIVLAFVTGGTVPGGVASPAERNLVVAAISAVDGCVQRILQSPIFNEAIYQYKYIEKPSIAMDDRGIIYVAAHAIQADENDLVLLFAFSTDLDNRSKWIYTCGNQSYNAYIPAASGFSSPRSVYISEPAAEYSAPTISTAGDQLFLSFSRLDIREVCLLALTQASQFIDVTPFQYMIESGSCTVCTE